MWPCKVSKWQLQCELQKWVPPMLPISPVCMAGWLRVQIGEGNSSIYWTVYSRENLKSHGTQSAYWYWMVKMSLTFCGKRMIVMNNWCQAVKFDRLIQVTAESTLQEVQSSEDWFLRTYLSLIMKQPTSWQPVSRIKWRHIRMWHYDVVFVYKYGHYFFKRIT